MMSPETAEIAQRDLEQALVVAQRAWEGAGIAQKAWERAGVPHVSDSEIATAASPAIAILASAVYTAHHR